MDVSGFITGSNGEKSKVPLGLLVVHHNDRKPILLASFVNYFSPYTIGNRQFQISTKSHPAFQDLALHTPEVSITS
jgi:hypothetical protein